MKNLTNKEIYTRLNFISAMAMAMIFTVHYFSKFQTSIDGVIANQIAYILRSISIIAVPLYLTITGFSYIYLKKEMSIGKTFINIILPTAFLATFNTILFDFKGFSYNFKVGFYANWFADLFLGLMIVLPFFIYWYHKNEKIGTTLAFIGTFVGMVLCTYFQTSNMNFMGIWVFLPYIPHIFTLTYLAFNYELENKVILLAIFIIGFLMVYSTYTDFYENLGITTRIIRSYFSIPVVMMTFSFIKLIMLTNIPMINYRFVSRASYFYYFTHYIMIHIFELWIPDFSHNNVMICYVIGVIGAYILAVILYVFFYKVIEILRLK